MTRSCISLTEPDTRNNEHLSTPDIPECPCDFYLRVTFVSLISVNHTRATYQNRPVSQRQ